MITASSGAPSTGLAGLKAGPHQFEIAYIEGTGAERIDIEVEGPALARLLDRIGDAYTVCERDSMVAFVPPFARFPYEVWIAPRRPLPGPWEMSAAEISDYASLLGELVTRYDRLVDRSFPYIMSLHAAPKGEERTFHFHTQFYPPLRTAEKLKYLAGVEQAGGAFLMDALPEETAARLRDVSAR